MTFNFVATTASMVALLLGIGWLLAGKLLLKRWQIAATEVGLLLGRRVGAVYLGLAVMFFLARSAPPSDTRLAISVGAVVGLGLLAGLGVFEFIARRAGPAILISVAIEVVLAVGFALVVIIE